MNKTRYISITAMMVAMYVVLSMVAKIPVIAHISLDLGYIVLAVTCYHMGCIPGMIVGGVGCVMVSMLVSGWFPPGWMLGNIAIGAICGKVYQRGYRQNGMVINCLITVVAVAIGILCIKTVIECYLYGIPIMVKVPKNAVAFIMDTAVMCIGLIFARSKAMIRLFGKYWLYA